MLPVHPVRARLRQGLANRAEDHGIVSFVDGWLVYEGEWTPFSLRAADSEIAWMPQGARLRLPEAQVIGLISLTNVIALKTALRQWQAEPSAEGLSRLPPRGPHPSAHARLALGMQLLGAFGLGIMTGATLGRLLVSHDLPPHFLTVASTAALIAASLSCFGQALVTPTRRRAI